MKKKLLFIILPIVLIAGILLGGTYFVNNRFIETDTIYDGISIEEIPIEGLTKDEALELIKEEKEKEIEDQGIDLIHEDFSYRINLEDIGYTYNYDEAVEKAFEIGRDGGFFKRIKSIWNLRDNPVDIELSHNYDIDNIQSIVNSIEEELLVEATDATISISNGNIEITDEIVGRELVKEELMPLIADSIETLENVEMPVETSEPEVTKDFLSQINGIIGSYSTSFAGSSSGRMYNIKHSSEPFNNLIVMPGEEISFNEMTGPRSIQNGYKGAPVIANGELTQGVGGGVCQTSTTLYNTLLLADVAITERSPHSIAQAYVPKGQDGAVADGYLDLKFKNDYDFPIYLKSQVVGTTVEFYVYGDTTVKDYTVRIDSEIVATVPYETHEQRDNSAPAGSRELVQEGRTGYRVRTYKSIIKDGSVIEREEISYDYYPKRDFIYKVGPAAPTAQKSEQPKKNPSDEEKPVEPEEPEEPEEPDEENSDEEPTEP